MSKADEYIREAVNLRDHNSSGPQQFVAFRHAEYLAQAIIEAIRELKSSPPEIPDSSKQPVCVRCGSTDLVMRASACRSCGQWQPSSRNQENGPERKCARCGKSTVFRHSSPLCDECAVEPKSTGLTFAEALASVCGMEGKTMRRRGWERSIGFNCYSFIYGDSDAPAKILQRDILATDWEIRP